MSRSLRFFATACLAAFTCAAMAAFGPNKYLAASLAVSAAASGHRHVESFMLAPASQPSVVTCSPTRSVAAPSPSPYTGQDGVARQLVRCERKPQGGGGG